MREQPCEILDNGLRPVSYLLNWIRNGFFILFFSLVMWGHTHGLDHVVFVNKHIRADGMAAVSSTSISLSHEIKNVGHFDFYTTDVVWFFFQSYCPCVGDTPFFCFLFTLLLFI